MKNKKLFIISLLILLAIVIAGICKFNSTNEAGEIFPNIESLVTAPEEVGERQERFQEELFSGKLVFGHESHTFQKCGERETLWIFDPDYLLKEKYEFLVKGQDPYTEVYAKLVGLSSPVGDDEDGFAADFESQITVTELKIMEDIENHPECTEFLE